MSIFAIHRGPTPLCEWDLETGTSTARKPDIFKDNMPVLEEDLRVGFKLDPAQDGVEYRIFIGDVPLTDIAPTLNDAGGQITAGRVFWRDLQYFESARGKTKLLVEARREGEGDGGWAVVHATWIYVLPSKVGEQRYEDMSADLNRVSYSLLSDLYGKSQRTADLGYAWKRQAFHSREAELHAIEETLARLELLLNRIQYRPASRVVTDLLPQQYWGLRRVHPASIAATARRGVDLRTAPRPVKLTALTKTESFDVAEHRITKAFLEHIRRRCALCSSAALGHARAIHSEKHLRDVHLGDGASIYESVDLPKIATLKSAAETARRCETIATALQTLPLFQNVPATLSAPHGGSFQRTMEYRALLNTISTFLLRHAAWYNGPDYSLVTKLTSRMFEHWTFLRIVNAFRLAGLDLCEWTDALRHNLRSRFLIDFERGLMFEGAFGSSFRVRLRYEPWILTREAAVKSRETLYRGSTGKTAWSPDIVIECLRHNGDKWVTVYAVVMDCKYTRQVMNHHWNGITKYLEIRSTDAGRQVSKQLWLVWPGEPTGIRSEDSEIQFTADGPNSNQNEVLRFQLVVPPDELTTNVESSVRNDTFAHFAEGTLAFLRRSFIEGSND
ncbi:MAG: DUF2357 domain-containing protein [Pirellulales bacterium]